MDNSYREKIQAIGDIVFEKMDIACTNIKENLSKSTKGVTLTYNIQQLQKEKDMLEKKIGRRVCIIRRKGQNTSEDIFNDNILRKYFYKMDILCDNIESLLAERKKRLNKKS
ncbi:hypothetical protein MHK_007335 [Candidatus Magnetomorum sp. HK-1]|nr:hypothetical protein MHK_007335 [Candidatus Magnetomorum sp. HK-1]